MDLEDNIKNIDKNWFALYTKSRGEFKAAEQLNMSRMTLRKKMREYGIEQ